MENNPPAKVTTMDMIKNQRTIIWIVGIVVLLILCAVLVMTIHPTPPPPPVDTSKANKAILNAYEVKQKTAEDTWVARGETEINQQKKELNDLKDLVQRMQSQNNPVNALNNQRVPNSGAAGFINSMTGVQPPIAPGVANNKGLPPEKDFPAFSSPNGGSPPATPVSLNLNDPGMGIKVVGNDFAPQPPATIFPGKEEKKEDKKGEGRLNEWMPTGSFMSGILLSGLDAPTGGQSQTNPHPVLIRVQNEATLPNRFRENVKECFIVGAGYGDISSERAYIRTETLSCVMKTGRTLDVPIKGFIAGEDGKNGMRGRLVSKDGQMIAKALLAGFASGIGTAFQQSTMTQSISPLGATNTVTPNQALQAGAYGGVSQSMNMLAQHYIKLAEQTFPIIEIDAGRKIDIVITKGFEINLLDSADALEPKEK